MWQEGRGKTPRGDGGKPTSTLAPRKTRFRGDGGGSGRRGTGQGTEEVAAEELAA